VLLGRRGDVRVGGPRGEREPLRRLRDVTSDTDAFVVECAETELAQRLATLGRGAHDLGGPSRLARRAFGGGDILW